MVLIRRLAALLAECREEKPDVEIRLFEVPLAQQLKGLRDDLYDPGFPQAVNVNEDIVVQPVCSEPLLPATFSLCVGECDEHVAQKNMPRAAPEELKHKADLHHPASLKTSLGHYAALHAQTYGETMDAVTLIPHMLKAFMAADRGFKKSDASKPASQKPPQREATPP